MRFFAENIRLYAEDCSGRKICPIPQVVANQLSPGLMQFDWSAGSASVFQARYRLGEDTTWIPLKAIYGNKWLAYDLGPGHPRRVPGDAVPNASLRTTGLVGIPVQAFTKGCANNDGYCTSTGGSESVWINQLSLGEWSNKTGDDGGYDLFTPNDLSITAGKSYTLALQPGGFTRARDTLYWRVWVDFNQDKDFNDPGEQVFQAKSRGRSATVQGKPGLFQIPSRALTACGLAFPRALMWMLVGREESSWRPKIMNGLLQPQPLALLSLIYS